MTGEREDRTAMGETRAIGDVRSLAIVALALLVGIDSPVCMPLDSADQPGSTAALACLEHEGGACPAAHLDPIRHRIDRGDYAAAEEEAREALVREQRTHGPDSCEAAQVLDLLVETLLEKGRGGDPDTLRLAETAVAIKEQQLGTGSPEVAASLVLLGEVHRRNGDNDAALAMFSRARAIREREFPPDHEDVADSLYHVALVLTAMGDYVDSQRLLDRALDIYQDLPGRRDREIGLVMGNLATLLYLRGDRQEAKEMFERALAIRERGLGPDHPHVAAVLHNYGSLLHDMGELDRAKEVFERALAIQEATLGPAHPRLANTLNNLGLVLQEMGDLDGARECFVRTIATHEKLLGPDHPMVASGRDSLGTFLYAAGDLVGARVEFERALGIRRVALGPEHPDVAVILNNLARALAASGMTAEAIGRALEAEAISSDHLQLTIHALSEREALSYASARSTGLNLALSLGGKEPDPSTTRDVWDAVIRSRAIVLDEMANRHRSIGGMDDPGIVHLAAELRDARSDLARLIVNGPGREEAESLADRVAAARRRREKAERALAGQSLPFRNLLARGRARLGDVQAELPEGSALVAYYTYSRSGFGVDERHHGPVPSYAAFVQSGARTRPVIIQLGEAAGIEREISRWLETVTALPGPDREALGVAERDARAAGGAVRAAVWDPLAGAVDGAERVFVVPDGALHLVNLAALPAGEAGYMVETGPTIHYLAAERDLIGAEETRTSLGGLLIIGDPDFDAAANATPPAEELRGEEREKPGGFTPEGAGRQTRSGCAYFRDMRFGRLPETAREAKEITELLSRETEPDETEVMLLTGAGASEAAFKRNAPGRRIIHLATHGFFLGGRCPTVDPNGRGIGGLGPADHTNTSATGAENPLLLSGLVFAGANRRDGATSAEEDGILTAEEIAAVDLGGVEWAVLSACDTGMGEIKAGEGIFGLRRAFQVAGAGTLIISLWGVEDRATADWMRELYAGRIAGLSTADAVRRASLAILSRRRDAGLGTHPFYWGAFVASGKWR